MPISEDDINLIEKYLDQACSQEERERFESLLKNDSFKEELKLQMSVIEGIREFHKTELKDSLKQELLKQRDELRNKQVREKARRNLLLAVAASVTVFLIASLLLFFTGRERQTTDELFMVYYKPYPGISSTRGASDEGSNLAKESFQYYSEGEYRQAASGLEQLIEEDNPQFDADNVKLMLGNCYLNLGQTHKALAIFMDLERSAGKIVKQHARWYAALTLLKAGESDQSLMMLDSISESGSLYSEKAHALIKDLRYN